jgi:hypothetical protein
MSFERQTPHSVLREWTTRAITETPRAELLDKLVSAGCFADKPSASARISRMLHDDVLPSVKVARALARIHGCSPQWILRLVDAAQRKSDSLHALEYVDPYQETVAHERSASTRLIVSAHVESETINENYAPHVRALLSKGEEYEFFIHEDAIVRHLALLDECEREAARNGYAFRATTHVVAAADWPLDANFVFNEVALFDQDDSQRAWAIHSCELAGPRLDQLVDPAKQRQLLSTLATTRKRSRGNATTLARFRKLLNVE